jgi:hypothetical protein
VKCKKTQSDSVKEAAFCYGGNKRLQKKRKENQLIAIETG